MTDDEIETLLGSLVCPTCHGRIERLGGSLHCPSCSLEYPISPAGQPDMRLLAPRLYPLEVTIGDEWIPDDFDFGPIRPDPSPTFDVRPIDLGRDDLSFGNRLTEALVSHFPHADEEGGLMLDLGCGDRTFADVGALTGLSYVGLDFDGDRPDVLGDAHSLPFADATFRFVLSVAVLEHIRHPLVAMREVHRVLEPGGLFIGTVAFLEPFHMNSLYHHSHLGTYNSLASAGLEVLQIEPNRDWDGLQAIVKMGYLPDRPRSVAVLLAPLRGVAYAWERVRRLTGRHRGADARLLAITGGFRFIARKPPGAGAPEAAG